MPSYLGIEIGGTKLQLVAGNEAGRIFERRRLVVEPGRGAAGIREQIKNELPALCQSAEPRAVGVGFGGPVDWLTGRICRSHQVEGWSEFELAGWLHGLTDLPVRVDNDANVAALGEARHGAGVGCSPVFYMTLGSGVGGGLALQGEIYHGSPPGETEIGHLRLDRTGTTVESRCSGWAVDARIRELIKREPNGLLAQQVREARSGEARFLAAAVAKGDAAAMKLLREVAEDVAFGLSHVAHLFHPQIIILGGGLSGVGEPLRAAVAEALPLFVMEAFAPGPRVALTALGEDAVTVGALALARTGVNS
jgi:glucokinase